MAQKYLFICDKCGCEKESKSSYSCEGFSAVKITAVQSRFSRTSNSKEYNICDDCLKKVGLIVEQGSKEDFIPGAADRLYDIIAQIVRETTPVNS